MHITLWQALKTMIRFTKHVKNIYENKKGLSDKINQNMRGPRVNHSER